MVLYGRRLPQKIRRRTRFPGKRKRPPQEKHLAEDEKSSRGTTSVCRANGLVGYASYPRRCIGRPRRRLRPGAWPWTGQRLRVRRAAQEGIRCPAPRRLTPAGGSLRGENGHLLGSVIALAMILLHTLARFLRRVNVFFRGLLAPGAAGGCAPPDLRFLFPRRKRNQKCAQGVPPGNLLVSGGYSIQELLVLPNYRFLRVSNLQNHLEGLRLSPFQRETGSRFFRVNRWL